MNQPHEQLRAVIDAYRAAEGSGPLCLQVHLSYARDDATALPIAYEQWRTNVFARSLLWDLELPAQFDEAARYVPPEAMRGLVLVSSDLGWHAARLQEYADLGFEQIYLHHVGQEQEEFLEAFGNRVLPQLSGGAR